MRQPFRASSNKRSLNAGWSVATLTYINPRRGAARYGTSRPFPEECTMQRARTIAIIDGHPDSNPDRLCHALADAYEAGAKSGGHSAEILRVSTHDFPLLRTQADYAGDPPDGLHDAVQTITTADHLVLIYPLWLGTLPALTKGFLEQVFHQGIAFQTADGSKWPKGRLQGKSARVIVTMGMPALVYRFWFGAHSLKSLERNILGFIGYKPVRDTVFGLVDQVGSNKRASWLAHVKALGRKGV